MKLNRERRRVQVHFDLKDKSGQLLDTVRSRTQQHFKKECDINFIMKRYQTTGELPALIKEGEISGDFSDPMDLQAAMEIVLTARSQFDALSSHVRERFHNDPQEFLAFANSPENAEELAKMGLMKPEAVERVSKAREDKLKRKLREEIAREAAAEPEGEPRPLAPEAPGSKKK